MLAQPVLVILNYLVTVCMAPPKYDTALNIYQECHV